jgi:hypothetical protein
MRALFSFAAITLTVQSVLAADIQSLDRNRTLTWSGAYTAGVVNVQTRGSLLQPWIPRENYYTSNLVGSAQITVSPTQTFVRLLSVDISTNTPNHYTNLLQSYGILETVAGRGRTDTDVSHWSNSFEGEWATNVDLSRPHVSFGIHGATFSSSTSEAIPSSGSLPKAGLFTYAGTHTAGDNGDSDYATNLNLSSPNGGWMRSDGTLYILDTDNAKVRRVDTNGFMTTLFTTPPLGDGRAFWISTNETLAYFGSG